MRRLIVAGLSALSLAACESGAAGGLLESLGSLAGNQGVTTAEIDAGLRQALEVGATNVAGQLGQQDGFFGDDRIRIPLPGRLQSIQSDLGKIGLSGPLDDLQLRMNRAASAAMPEARALVVDAVKSITLDDAVGILRGGNNAATDFLRARTETQLRQAFSPHIDTALGQTGAFQALDGVTSQYGLGGIGQSLKSDLAGHAVNFGLDGMFFYVAEEERKIRENPVARTTELLRRVFGSV